MLTPLGTALTGWRPSRGPADDPLAAIRAAWSDIVGDDGFGRLAAVAGGIDRGGGDRVVAVRGVRMGRAAG